MGGYLVISQALNPSVVSFCSWVSPYSHLNANSRKACQKNCLPVTSSEFGVLLQTCIDSRSFEQGKRLHSQIREAGLEKNRDLLPRLVKMYSVCGRIHDARKLFDRMPKWNLDIFVWTAMISGYVKNGMAGEALELFYEMLKLGVNPDSYTFSALLKASVELGLVRLIVQLHSLIVKYGCGLCLSVANSLIHAYGSFGDVYGARKVFDRMEFRDVVSWSSMIHVCSHVEIHTESMPLFSRMQFDECLKPNELTVVSLLPACSFFSSLRKGQAIHAYAIRNGFVSNVIVGSALVTMYSRCGDPNFAYKVFSGMERQNVITWTSMIEGFALNGKFNEALNLFKGMQDQGLKPTYITLVVILSACSHGGFVDDGLEIFETMQEKFGIQPRVEHCACVVDMLGRAGRLDDAEQFIERMGIGPSSSVFGSLLGACQVYCNVELGERLAQKLFELEPRNAANYVILSNIYASAGRWDDVGRVRKSMIVKGLFKESGCSWVEIKDKVYVFGAHDRTHLESDKIYEMLEELSDRIVKAGYVPSTKYVLLDVEDDDKKKLLCTHSERLAIAFGLLKVPPTVPIRIVKNLRVCGDCHDAVKLISKVEDVERLMEIIKQAATEGALLLYTLADPSMAKSAEQACKLWGVPSADILRPTTEAIAAHLGVAPSGIPRGARGRKAPLTEEYFRRIEAIDFTIKQDDGAQPRNLSRAHIVLVGVSRTGKTPLSIYLAQKGYKVANIPVVMGVELPKTLFEINQEKVFGLTINPVVLMSIRKARAKSLGFDSDMRSNYSEMDYVREELEYTNRIFMQNPVWPVIEVTGKAIEETAAVVVRMYHDRKQRCSMPRISKRY